MKIVNKEIDILQNFPILIYGASRICQMLANVLLKLNTQIIGIAVTDSSKNPKQVMGIRVRNLKEYKQFVDSAVIFVAASPCYHDEITAYCKDNGFKNIILVTPELANQVYSLYYKKFLLEHDILVNQKTLSINNGVYLNPFTELEMQSAIYLDEMGDFILPSCFNDYSMTKEGPYELGDIHLSERDIVLDLGANMGLFSVYAVSKKCISYAFEPDSDLQQVISRHSELNGNKIHIVPYAVSNQCGEAKFYIDSFNSGANSMVIQDGGGEKRCVSIQQITIDEFVERQKLERVDFIKADIEGAERLMLMGAENTLRKFAPKLALCTYHLPDDKEIMTELILKANPRYKIHYKWMKLYANI